MESRLNRALVAWVDGVRARYRMVLAVSAVSSLALVAYTALSLGVNANSDVVGIDLKLRRQLAYQMERLTSPI